MQVPQSTIEKPLTVIDYIAGLAGCSSVRTLRDYAAACPMDVRQDDRFAKAVAGRLAAIKAGKR